MEHRSLPVAAFLKALFLAALAGMAWAGDTAGGPSPEQQATWDESLAKAKALQQEGRDKKSAAENLFESEKLACNKKFRVYDCQAEARQRYIPAIKEARRLENEGKAIERQVKKEQLADKDQRRRDEAPQLEADLRQREAETGADRAAAEAKREQRLAGKEEKAAEGAKKRAANEERLRLKREKHEQKVAEKMERAARREARQAGAVKD